MVDWSVASMESLKAVERVVRMVVHWAADLVVGMDSTKAALMVVHLVELKVYRLVESTVAL